MGAKSTILSRTLALCTLLLLVGSSSALTQSLPAASPESVGMSSERLARLTRVMAEQATSGQIAGTVTLVARAGRAIYFEAAGFRDIEQKSPMTRDTTFRIASQTKAIVSVGVMMLIEEGRLL